MYAADYLILAGLALWLCAALCRPHRKKTCGSCTGCGRCKKGER